MLCALAAPAAAASAGGVVELPVAFQVKNTDTSAVPCQSDGASYTVRGHIAGPRALLHAGGREAITLYLYGFETGEWQYRLTTVPGYDFGVELARLGRVSLTIDMLGYGASGLPDGFQACTGSQADVAHQIVQQLRHGSYTVSDGRPIAFSTVVLAGHDIGGGIAQVEAYSYHDIDGLILLTWADQGFTPYLLSLIPHANLVCEQGGERAEGDRGPGGYVFFAGPDSDYRANLFTNTDPAVIDAAVALRHRNPCGYLNSAPPMLASDQAHLGEIHVPVLLIMGAQDPVFTEQGFELQRAHYTGTSDVTSVRMQDAGHFPMLSRIAPEYRALIAGWLTEHRFVSQAESIATRPTTPVDRLRLTVSPRSVRAGQRVRFRFRVTAASARSRAARTIAVAGATVRFAGHRARTDRYGQAVIVAALPRPGHYRATASTPATRSTTATVTSVPWPREGAT